MLKYSVEFKLQIVSRRRIILSIITLILAFILPYYFKAMARVGMLPVGALGTLSLVWRIVFQFVLPLFVIIESLACFQAPFTRGTLQWSCFRGESRKKHWHVKYIVFFIWLNGLWLSMVLATILSWTASWGIEMYSLENGFLSWIDQVIRFVSATFASYSLSLLFSMIAFFMVILFKGKRFEASLFTWLSFLFYQFVFAETAIGVGGIFGGVFNNWFMILTPIQGIITVSILSIPVLLFIACIIKMMALKRYARINLEVQDR